MDYELDMTASDIGEIVTIIRVQHLRLHVEPFAKSIGVKERVILNVEEGLGQYGLNVLKKIKKKYPYIKISINVSIDESRKGKKK